MVPSLIAVIILCALVIFGVVSLISMQIARKSAAPFFPTPAHAIRKALRAANLKSGQAFYDLGAGTGKTLLIAEKEFGAKAVGFEISIPFYLIAKINLFLHGSKAEIRFKNFFAEDIKNADVVFCFLAIRTMQKMKEKIKNEMRPGRMIIVYAFPFPDWEPKMKIPVRDHWDLFIYKN